MVDKALGPAASCKFALSLGEGSPTKIENRKKLVPISSLLEELDLHF